MFYSIFTLYVAVTLCKKSEKFNAPISHKKNSFCATFLSKNLGTRLSQKYINFKHKYCCNFKPKIRKVTCTDFSQNLKNLLLDPIWEPIGTKTFKKKLFLKKTMCVKFTCLCCHNLMQKIRKVPCIDQKNFTLGPFWTIFGPKTLKTSYSHNNHLHQF